MDFECVTPKYVHKMWRGRVALEITKVDFGHLLKGLL